MTKHLIIDGLVAAGFDPHGEYLLTVSHAGHSVFSTRTWQRIAQDSESEYPENGISVGIGPIDGFAIPVKEIDYDTGEFKFSSPDGKLSFKYENGALTISEATS